MRSVNSFTLLLCLMSSVAIAKPSACELSIIAHGAQLKADAKKLKRAIEDEMDSELTREGRISMGIATRFEESMAERILADVRTLESHDHASTDVKLSENLCGADFNLSILLGD